ncbi:hypothetical protein D3C85_587220 [compost metagenome]
MPDQGRIQVAAGDGAHQQQVDLLLANEAWQHFFGETLDQVGVGRGDRVVADQLLEGLAVLGGAAGDIVVVIGHQLGIEHQGARQRGITVQVVSPHAQLTAQLAGGANQLMVERRRFVGAVQRIERRAQALALPLGMVHQP